MKKIYILLVSIIFHQSLCAQTDSISTRDTAAVKYKIRKNILPKFQNLLNFISSASTEPNEVEDAVSSRVTGNKEQKLFFDDLVNIENDLTPGADTNFSIRGDFPVKRYLQLFNTNYAKSEKSTVTLVFKNISPLKKVSYFYYNVLFECSYTDTNVQGSNFKTFERIAEIRLVKDKTWYPYIHGIRFTTGNDLDSTNIHHAIIKDITDVNALMMLNDQAEQNRLMEDANKIQALLEDGDEEFNNGKFDDALKIYKQARAIDFYDKETIEKINAAKKSRDKKIADERAQIALQKHIEELKETVKSERNNYNFKIAKILCDSLLNDFGVKDTSLIRLNDELSFVTASLAAIETAMQKNLQEAVEISEKKIKETINPLYKAEFHYRLAFAYITFDISMEKRILENLNRSIVLSGKKHQQALKQRANYFLKQNQIINAVEDATQLINNDSRNPENYALRASIYKSDRQHNNAIDDYEKAIDLKTINPAIFLDKAKLEFEINQYSEVIKTTNAGLQLAKCYALLFFYRALAKEKLKSPAEAGKDFNSAILCGLAPSEKAIIKFLSDSCYNRGNSAYGKTQYLIAQAEFTNSILIDSNENSLYGRAKTFTVLGKNNDALDDLNVLVLKNKNYPGIYNQRGMALLLLDRCNEAIADFEVEIKKNPVHAFAYYNKGACEMKQQNFTAAATSFENAAQISFSDSAYYFASLAHYKSKNYEKAIALSQKAREKKSKKFEIYYICGRAYYDKKEFKNALSEFEKAKQLVGFNADLYFWLAATHEAKTNFEEAKDAYSKLDTSTIYRDTAAFRSGICLIKTKSVPNYQIALTKFKTYINSTKTTDKSEARAWAAYTYLLMDLIKEANEYIEQAKKANEQNYMVQYVLACAYTKDSMFDDAFISLEKALSTKLFLKEEVESEKLFKALFKREKFKELMVKYFK